MNVCHVASSVAPETVSEFAGRALSVVELDYMASYRAAEALELLLDSSFDELDSGGEEDIEEDFPSQLSLMSQETLIVMVSLSYLQVNEKSFELKVGIYIEKEGDKTGMDGCMLLW